MAGAGPQAAGPEAAGTGAWVEEPAKVMRIGRMARQLLEEVRHAPLDERARSRLGRIYERSVLELQDGIAPDLARELERISLSFPAGSVPSDAELRVAQAQLVGWLDGLFKGIQAAAAVREIANQTLAVQQQLRRIAPPVPEGGQAGAPARMGGAAGTAAAGRGGRHGGSGYL